MKCEYTQLESGDIGNNKQLHHSVYRTDISDIVYDKLFIIWFL